MVLRALTCPACGGPLPSNAKRAVVTCPHCKANVADDGPVILGMSFRQALRELDAAVVTGEQRARVAGVPYRLLGRIAQGESCDVFLAERARALTERVILKVLRAPEDEDLLDREWAALGSLLAPGTSGAAALLRRIPVPVARGKVEETRRPALVLRASSGFSYTFADVRRVHPAGVDGRHAVWMWRRVLETLALVHAAGFSHGAILPQHLLVHPRDHGVLLVGWSCASRLAHRAALPVVSDAHRDLYPDELLRGEAPSVRTDIAMTARNVAWLLGGSPRSLPPSVPGPIRDLVAEQASDRADHDAWALRSKVGHAARAAYGPPQFYPFEMP